MRPLVGAVRRQDDGLVIGNAERHPDQHAGALPRRGEPPGEQSRKVCLPRRKSLPVGSKLGDAAASLVASPVLLTSPHSASTSPPLHLGAATFFLTSPHDRLHSTRDLGSFRIVPLLALLVGRRMMFRKSAAIVVVGLLLCILASPSRSQDEKARDGNIQITLKKSFITEYKSRVTIDVDDFI